MEAMWKGIGLWWRRLSGRLATMETLLVMDGKDPVFIMVHLLSLSGYLFVVQNCGTYMYEYEFTFFYVGTYIVYGGNSNAINLY